jgi:hypothetical protein
MGSRADMRVERRWRTWLEAHVLGYGFAEVAATGQLLRIASRHRSLFRETGTQKSSGSLTVTVGLAEKKTG